MGASPNIKKHDLFHGSISECNETPSDAKKHHLLHKKRLLAANIEKLQNHFPLDDSAAYAIFFTLLYLIEPHDNLTQTIYPT